MSGKSLNPSLALAAYLCYSACMVIAVHIKARKAKGVIHMTNTTYFFRAVLDVTAHTKERAIEMLEEKLSEAFNSDIEEISLNDFTIVGQEDA